MVSSRSCWGIEGPMYVKFKTRGVSGTAKEIHGDVFGISSRGAVVLRRVLLVTWRLGG